MDKVFATELGWKFQAEIIPWVRSLQDDPGYRAKKKPAKTVDAQTANDLEETRKAGHPFGRPSGSHRVINYCTVVEEYAGFPGRVVERETIKTDYELYSVSTASGTSGASKTSSAGASGVGA